MSNASVRTSERTATIETAQSVRERRRRGGARIAIVTGLIVSPLSVAVLAVRVETSDHMLFWAFRDRFALALPCAFGGFACVALLAARARHFEWSGASRFVAWCGAGLLTAMYLFGAFTLGLHENVLHGLHWITIAFCILNAAWTFFVALVAWAMREPHRSAASYPRCSRCKYSLRGIHPSHCPECGSRLLCWKCRKPLPQTPGKFCPCAA